MARRKKTQAIIGQRNRLNGSGIRGRRVGNQGGFSGFSEARSDVYPLMQRIAHQHQQNVPRIPQPQTQPNFSQPPGQVPAPQPIQQHSHGRNRHAHGGGGPGHSHGQGGGGGGGFGGGGNAGGGGGSPTPQVPQGQINPPPTGAPGTPGSLGPPTLSPTLGNNYGNTFQSTNTYQATTQQPTAGISQGSFMNPEAHDTERFFYDTFQNGQTYIPMPGSATGGPGNANYPFQGYAAPPSNYGYFNQGAGWDFGNTNHTPMSWDQYAQVMAQPDIANDIQPFFKQTVAPAQAQGVWWANPVITDPGYYDPWVEERNLEQHFGQATPGNVAGDTALGIYSSPQGKLDYYRYLAHQAGIPGYAQLTGPLAPGYHSPNIGGTYGAPLTSPATY
jgi:hypothetical protein